MLKLLTIEVPSQNYRELTQEVNQVLEVKEFRIATGDVADVKGTKRMLADKKKTAKWY